MRASCCLPQTLFSFWAEGEDEAKALLKRRHGEHPRQCKTNETRVKVKVKEKEESGRKKAKLS
ncbi:hypothetical protein C4D60_Mb03t04590 [Musa balbisiana]|uniref:Uncharacterized protein n=1 Tax=Musa balbisiana TaxID=52838 RepID=A0A4S8J8L0_MUSBA|nr:hypothetical protein C4D60_Mb03t04590 [Musa balbisiana]